MSAKTYRVALVGTFDLKNYGDLLFPDVFRSEMSRIAPEIETVLFSPVGGEKPFEPGTWVYPVRELDRVHGEKPLDAIVIGGGALIRADLSVVANQAKYDDRGRVTDLWALPILFAAAHGIPVLFNAPGVPYDFDPAMGEVLGALLRRVDYIAVRNSDGPAILRSMAPEVEAVVVPDTVVLVPECYTGAELADAAARICVEQQLPERFALVQLNGLEPDLTAADYEKKLRWLEEALGCPVVLMPIGYVHHDVEVLEGLHSQTGFAMIRGELTPMEMYALIGRAACFAGTSMHGCMTAMLQGVPAVAINISSRTDHKKISDFMACYGMQSNDCGSIMEMTEEMLCRCAAPERIAGLTRQAKAHMERIRDGVHGGTTKKGSLCGLYAGVLSTLRQHSASYGMTAFYFDLGGGFTPLHMTRVHVDTQPGEHKITAEVKLPAGCRRVRFDPVEDMPLVVSDLRFTTESGDVLPSDSNGVEVDGREVFLTWDPWYIIPVTEDARTLKVEMVCHVPEAKELMERMEWDRAHELARHRRKEKALREELDKIQAELAIYQQEYAAAIIQRDGYLGHANKLSMDIQLIHSSYSWRITAPIRAVTGRLRKMPHVVLVVRALRHLRRHGLRSTWMRVKDHRARVRRQKAAMEWEKRWREDRGVLAPPPAFGVTQEEYENQQKTVFPREIKFSILVPLYNTPENFLREMIASVQHQSYSNWELCLADGSDAAHGDVERICLELAAADGRIKYQKLEQNLGISGNTNACIDMATGDYIGLFDHDDLLHPSALYENMVAICEQGADFIYTDENTFHDTPRDAYCPHFKPDFAPDTLRSYNYICHFTVFGRALMEEVGTFRPECDGSQDYDMILRLTERARKIVHIPKILYYWRASANSTAADISAKPYIMGAAARALREHLERIGLKGVVSNGRIPSTYRIRYDIAHAPLVSILIPSCDHWQTLKRCVDSIREKTTYPNWELVIVENNSKDPRTFAYYDTLAQDPRIQVVRWEGKFNYSAINNFGFRYTHGQLVVLLNNDISVITPEWLEEMVMYAQRSDVGAVGAMLYYPSDKVQHAGVVLGIGGVAGHAHKYFPRGDYGYMSRMAIAQNYSACTAACLMVPRKVYEQINGLDERFEVAFNDVDFCMRIRQAGYLIVWTPYAELYHYESESRGAEDTPEKVKRFNGEVERFQKRWAKELAAGDPYYNPNFCLDKEDFSIRPESLL